MLVLAFDTATLSGSVALVGPDGVIVEMSVHSKATHSERLLPAIHAVLAAADLRIADVEGFATGLGPGSFTGLRIALSTAKGLALGTGRPLVGVPTLDALAANMAPAPLLCPMLDARKGEVFAAIYRSAPDGALAKETRELSIDPERLMDEPILQREAGPVTVLGSGARLYADRIRRKLGGRAVFAPPERDYPRAAVVGRLGREELLAGRAHDPGRLAPRYVRASDAEIARARRLRELATDERG